MDDGHRAQRRWTWALGCALAATSALHLRWPVGPTGVATYLTATVGASVLAWMSFARRRGPVRMWAAIGLSASALADAIYQLYPFVRGVSPDVSIADPPWILSYVALAMAMLVALRQGERRARRDVDGVIDMALIGLAAFVVISEMWLSKTLGDSSYSLFVRGVWAVYPICDAALVAIILRTVIERRAQMVTGAMFIIGASLWLFSDFVWMAVTPAGLFSAGLDVGWMVGAVFLAGGCWLLPDSDAQPVLAELDDYTPVGRARVALAIAPLLLPGLIDAIAFYQGHDVNPVSLLIFTSLFAVLAGARAVRLLAVRDEAQRRLARSERHYRKLAANSSDAVLLVDARGRIINEAPTFAEMVGRPTETVNGHFLAEFIPGNDLESFHVFDEILASPHVVFSRETAVPCRGGDDIWLSGRAVNMLDDPDVGAIVFNVHDITGRKQAEDELAHHAFHDSLTGLANRALFHDRVEHALVRRSRSGLDPAVIYLDLDGFKNVNDSLGHEAGDQLLREVGERLQEVVRSGDTVARLGGDEFGILVDESMDAAFEAQEIAARALQCVSERVQLGPDEITVSASIGIAHADFDSTASSLLRDADVAMYEAKAMGKAQWVVYEPKMRDAAMERLRLESDLAHAVERNELRLVYQPVVELESGRVVGFEALVRWDHPVLGQIMPDRFIPIAEDSGLIVAIGQWVLDQACATAVEWREQYGVDVTMAVNVSARQLASANLFEHVSHALATGLAPSDLVLEMTETVLVKDPLSAASKLAELRKLGVRLAIDDFGTGYSSLSYLRQFPVDILKIDGSFVRTITERVTVSPIVRGLLDLGRSLNLDMVAEGIESGDQLEQLRDQHCPFGQGYLFAGPLAADQVPALLLSGVERARRVESGACAPPHPS